MTHTLHRLGSVEELKGDYVIMVIIAKDFNEEGSGQKVQQFTRIVLKHHPVNFGTTKGRGIWEDPESFISKLTDGVAVYAVFNDKETIRQVIEELRIANLGLSINVSGLLEDVGTCCKSMGFVPHAAEQSVGIMGKTNRLPDRNIVEINSLCGHGMVPFALVDKVMDLVKQGKMTPADGAQFLSKPCECGVFNTRRAEEFLEQTRVES